MNQDEKVLCENFVRINYPLRLYEHISKYASSLSKYVISSTILWNTKKAFNHRRDIRMQWEITAGFFSLGSVSLQ